MKRKVYIILILTIAITACSTRRKVDLLIQQQIRAEISLPQEIAEDLTFNQDFANSDTLVVKDLQGNEVNFMRAVKDDDGQMVATAELAPAVVIARFRNVAERNGKIDLVFDISIPKQLQDPQWQIRFYPIFYILEDTVRLDELHITGKDYRYSQLKGYEQYAKFINSIITNDDELRRKKALELFIERNIPQVYSLRTDSSYVSDAQIEGLFGVTLAEAKEYYTNKTLRMINNRKKRNKSKKFEQYVKSPFIEKNIRLDTVITTSKDRIYTYVQQIETRNKLRKVDLVLEGEIFAIGQKLYNIPPTKPLTFYISSVSTFAEPITRYVKKVIYRRAEANTMAYIDFPLGSYKIDTTLHENSSEIARVKENILELVNNKVYNIDSIVVSASSSPEGTVAANTKLSNNRSLSIKRYFETYANDYRSTLIKQQKDDASRTFGLGTDKQEYYEKEKYSDITFLTRSTPENWDKLHELIQTDTVISPLQKRKILKCFDIKDLDKREKELSSLADYRYIREQLYPLLRTVKFQFYLHRKGMLKDTINTTQVDTIYQQGLTALRERDYKRAIELLRPYQDINTAVAYLSLSYNKSALAILEKYPSGQNAKVEYMMALIHSREGKPRQAVEHFIRSVQLDRSMMFRGNLDPEIAVLIKKYNITGFDSPEEDYQYDL